jgi:hypothetical protein
VGVGGGLLVGCPTPTVTVGTGSTTCRVCVCTYHSASNYINACIMYVIKGGEYVITCIDTHLCTHETRDETLSPTNRVPVDLKKQFKKDVVRREEEDACFCDYV